MDPKLSIIDYPQKYFSCYTAIIFVDENGENEIIIHPGANNKFSKLQCFEILENFTSKDTWVVLQNEINLSVEIATKAKELGFKVCYSAAPFDSDHARKMLPHIDLLAMNETELKELQKSLGENVFNLDILNLANALLGFIIFKLLLS
jgi:ribokinase